jgi:uncharacterized protein (DUF952 family)
MNNVVYKIFRVHEWLDTSKSDSYKGSNQDQADGYIHLSAANQVVSTVERYFLPTDELVVAAVDAIALGNTLRWEPSLDGQLYPHLYSDLPISAIRRIIPLLRDSAGNAVFPVD